MQENQNPNDEFQIDAILAQLEQKEQQEQPEQNEQQTPAAQAGQTPAPQAGQTPPAEAAEAAPEEETAPAEAAETEAATPDKPDKPDKPEPAEKPEKAKKERKKRGKGKKRRKSGCLSVALWLSAVAILSLGLAAAGLFAASDYLGLGKDVLQGETSHTVQIEVAQGATVQQIAQTLEDEGVLLSRHLFLLYLKLTGKGDNMNYGVHDFTNKMGYTEILESLAEPAKAEDVSVTIPAAKQLDDVFAILEKAGVCPAAELRQEALTGTFESPLLAAVPKDGSVYCALEGYLFPDTYSFYPNDSAHRVLQKMLDNTEEKFTPDLREAARQRGLTTHELLTLASIVELETDGYYDEQPRVAQVFYNRLNKWPAGTRKLQSDPTMKYPYGNGRYNTYEVEGLPPGPLCTVTQKALRAAAHPDETVTAFYFVTDTQGKYYYNDTLEGHDATIARLRSEDLWLSE